MRNGKKIIVWTPLEFWLLDICNDAYLFTSNDNKLVHILERSQTTELCPLLYSNAYSISCGNVSDPGNTQMWQKHTYFIL